MQIEINMGGRREPVAYGVAAQVRLDLMRSSCGSMAPLEGQWTSSRPAADAAVESHCPPAYGTSYSPALAVATKGSASEVPTEARA
jgi:hypothetical protein